MDMLNFINNFFIFISKHLIVLLSCVHDKPGKKRVLLSIERKLYQPRPVYFMK